jgi:hypothetical protein
MFHQLNHLEVLHHAPHGRPLPRLVGSAFPSNGERARHLLPPQARSRQARIEQLALPTVRDHPAHPADEVPAPFLHLLPRRRPPREHLQHDDAEAVDVPLRGALHSQRVPGGHVPERAAGDDAGPDVGVVPADDPREAEAGDPRCHALVQQDVARLDVPVDGVEGEAVVEEREPAGGAEADPEAMPPSDRSTGRPRLLVSQPRLEAPVAHVLGDQEVLVAKSTVAEQGNEVRMLHLHNGIHFGHELAFADEAVATRAEPLERSSPPIGELSSVDSPKAAVSYDACVAEIIGGFEDGIVRGDPPRCTLRARGGKIGGAQWFAWGWGWGWLVS